MSANLKNAASVCVQHGAKCLRVHLIAGNMSGQLGRELSLDLWENFGMSAYPDMSDLGEYDPNSISFFKPPEGELQTVDI